MACWAACWNDDEVAPESITRKEVINLTRSYRGDLTDIVLAHNRLGHCGMRRIKALYPSLKVPESLFCDACTRARAHRFPFIPAKPDDRYKPGEYIASDGRGYFVPSLGGATYRFLYVDKKSGYIWFEPVADQTEQMEAFKLVYADSKARTGRAMRVFKSDGAFVYTRKAEFLNLLRELGIKREVNGADCPQQNAAPERANRTIDEGAASMMCHAGDVPAFLWAEAMACMTFVHNEAPWRETKEGSGKYISRTCVLEGHDRNYDPDHFRTFGCLAYDYKVKGKREGAYGLQRMKARKGILVGYSRGGAKCCRIYDKKKRSVLEVPYQYVVTHEGKFSVSRPQGVGPGGETASVNS